MCMKEYHCCLKFRRGDNSTYTFTKRGVVYLVSATPPKRLIGVLWNFTQFLHAHLQDVYYNCVKFHKNSISSLVGVALTRYILYMPTHPFRESISWIISPFIFWTATIFLHTHLQVFTKKGGGGMYLVSATPTKLLIEFLWNFTQL
jgi:hypothetical protein